MSTTMNAIISTGYGGPEVLQLQTVAKPTPKDNEILVNIKATAVIRAHTMMREGVPRFGRLFLGLTKPKHPIPGTEFAGEVEAVGPAVTKFKVGEAVFGATDVEGGCYAEYIAVPEDGVVMPMPKQTSFDEAAAILDGASTVLHFLRDKGQLQTGQRVLINGASGSLGTAAVQIAKQFGAHVTGVCSTKNLELVESLGADAVLDYTQTDFTATGQTYDLIFDTVGKRTFAECKNALTAQGRYLTPVAGLGVIAQSLWTGLVGGKKSIFAAAGLRSAQAKLADMVAITELLEAGHLKPVIDRCYSLAQIPEAHRYVDAGHKRGNLVVHPQ